MISILLGRFVMFLFQDFESGKTSGLVRILCPDQPLTGMVFEGVVRIGLIPFVLMWVFGVGPFGYTSLTLFVSGMIFVSFVGVGLQKGIAKLACLVFTVGLGAIAPIAAFHHVWWPLLAAFFVVMFIYCKKCEEKEGW